MAVCLRSGCHGVALAEWWRLCADCTAPLLDRADGAQPAAPGQVDQLQALGWDAVAWAERIAPSRWGNGVLDDPWLTSVRCLVLAAVITRRAEGCPHTGYGAVTPVVVIPRATGTLRCPSCAEAVVATVTTDGHACDRCGAVPVTRQDRVAAIVGAGLVVVAQLCPACTAATLALGALTSADLKP